MKLNEEKLTAYALNELPEDERRAIEKEIETSPEARKAVEEIRELSSALSEHYTEEEQIGLTDEQRETIYAAARKKKEQIIPFPRYVWLPLTSVAALAMIIFYIATPKMSGRMGKAIDIAERAESVATSVSPAKKSRPRMELKKPAQYFGNQNKPMPKATQRIVSSRRLVLSDIQLPNVSSADASQARGIGGFMMMPDEEQMPTQWGPSIENYTEIQENGYTRVVDNPLSTFSIDVDTASYANVRRFLKDGQLPPKDAVRIEEMINYFNYDYEPPHDGTPFTTHLALSRCPWNTQHKLVRIGLKGREIEQNSRPPLNLVFLLDVSGSMNSPNKLPLVKRAMSTLAQQLDDRDRVAIVVYAGASGLVLPPTSGANSQAILDALKHLQAGGGTNGGQGIELAYKTAQENYRQKGVNRVILCTDGDFNIGVTQGGDLNRLIEEKAKSGIFLSVLGFGTGNVKDSTMEQLADRGNGNYAYIDTFSEARKVLVDEMGGTLVTIAKDVKIQVEFNPARVAGYRLIGYENRMLAAEDFNDDKKDAGEIGAGHTVTALYEIIPTGQSVNDVPPVDDLKYQVAGKLPVQSEELLTVKLRYKLPDENTSSKLEFPLKDSETAFTETDSDFRFAASVAGFGMLLRHSDYKGDLRYDQVIEWAQGALGEDEFGYRREFIDLVRNAKALTK